MAPDRRTVLQTTCGAVAGVLAGCASGGSGGESSVEDTTDVTMVDSQFDPRNVHVGAGATITWTNEDGDAHTVTSASDNWEADVEVPGGETATHTFDGDGVYDVFCRFHGSSDLTGMSMKVGVGEATIEQPLGSDGGDDVGGGY